MTRKKVRAVLFDLDGTLLDTLEDIGSAMNHALGELGFPPHPIDDYRQLIGRGMEELVASALPPGARGQKDDLVARFRARYRANLVVTTRPYPGIPELLDALVGRALPLAILSNKPDAPTVRIVDQLLSRWPFRDVRGERTGTPRKPAPDAALDIAHGFKLEPSACAFVGDSAVDIETAKAAGMQSVGVLWGFRERDELEAAGADHVIGEPAELLDLLG